MKKIGLLIVFSLFTIIVWAQKAKEEINWKTVEEVEGLMQQQPKQVLVSIYTTWCSYCKKMDRNIYSQPEVIAYINEHFYAIKLNAEQTKNIVFQNKNYGYITGVSRRPVNALAHYWLQGQMSYPSLVLMDPGFKYPVVQPGYLHINQLEYILKYRGSEAYKTMSYDKFVGTNTFNWK